MTAPEFRAALKALNLRQNQLAEALGVNTRTVNRWAVGKAEVPKYAALVLVLYSRVEQGKKLLIASDEMLDEAAGLIEELRANIAEADELIAAADDVIENLTGVG